MSHCRSAAMIDERAHSTGSNRARVAISCTSRHIGALPDAADHLRAGRLSPAQIPCASPVSDQCRGGRIIGGSHADRGLVAASGCGTVVPKSGSYTFLHGEAMRVFGLRLPAGYDGHHPAGLVIAFHSWGGDEREFLGEPSALEEASRRGYILVAARGLGSSAPDESKNSWTFRGPGSFARTSGPRLCFGPSRRSSACPMGEIFARRGEAGACPRC